MKKITLLILFIAVSFTGFSQTTIAEYTFDADLEGWAAGAGATVTYDATTNYFTTAGSMNLTAPANKIAKKTNIDLTVGGTITSPGNYTLTYKVRGVAGAASKIRTQQRIGTTVVQYGDTTLDGTETGGDGENWTTVTHAFSITDSDLTNFQLQLKSLTDGETFYIDDLLLVQDAVSGHVLTANTVGSGTVTKNPDELSYADNQVVGLTATPNTHWQFINWSGDLTGSTNPDNIDMGTADKTVTANFEIDPAFTYDFLFDVNNDLEGWAPENGLTTTGPDTGEVTLVTEVNKYSRFSLVGFPIPSSEKFMQIKMQNLSLGDVDYPEGDDRLTVIIGLESKTIPITINDAADVSYEFDLSTLTTWTGDVSSIRLRFGTSSVANGASGVITGKSTGTGDYLIDHIVFNSIALSTEKVNFKDDANITIYPNPTSSRLSIQSPLAIEKVEVYNLLGQITMTVKTAELNVSNLSNGMYIVKIFQENDVISTKRFVKQ